MHQLFFKLGAGFGNEAKKDIIKKFQSHRAQWHSQFLVYHWLGLGWGCHNSIHWIFCDWKPFRIGFDRTHNLS